MTDGQRAEAAKIIMEMIAITSLMASTPQDTEVPAFMVIDTGRTFTESLADLAEIIGGMEFRNDTLLDAMNRVTEMQVMLEEMGNLL